MREEGEGRISKGGQGVTGARENGREGGVMGDEDENEEE